MVTIIHNFHLVTADEMFIDINRLLIEIWTGISSGRIFSCLTTSGHSRKVGDFNNFGSLAMNHLGAKHLRATKSVSKSEGKVSLSSYPFRTFYSYQNLKGSFNFSRNVLIDYA